MLNIESLWELINALVDGIIEITYEHVCSPKIAVATPRICMAHYSQTVSVQPNFLSAS